ncbi:hypothetical protein, conserved [Plasmodium gonderi]|uniref:Myosin essential light chain ELC n=1 Tax=Plasmodium gonderi TaxID=77519 RepID=A0A1Y1JF91_PLAGO|nr:hypothetical protein, conserved [Plasmodium gonderi]GAW79877.1 hypothetical protein, conserved [Plasmodium gonderi]
MEEKFREAFILFSSCNESMELHVFYELMNSFGILLTPEEKAELPLMVNMDLWLKIANKHYNHEDPFKHIRGASDQNSNIQIRTQNFIGVMKALDTRLTDKDLDLLLKIANPENKETINLNTISEKLAEAI